MKNKSQNEKLNEKERSHFENIQKEITCKDPDHKPPMHLHIPNGKRYIHICPACGQRSVLEPPQISWGINDREQLKYDFTLGVKKLIETKAPIKRGCPNGQCFCTGKCQEIIGWRDKTPLEISQERINQIR